MGKYSMLMERLHELALVYPGFLHVPIPAPSSSLELAHEPGYVAQVISCKVPEKIEREIGFPVGERVSRRALLAAGGTILAAHLALEHGLACNTAGGSHHAKRAHGAGFCTFNDVAVAALVLLSEKLAKKILIVDLDVHQGDGTADILAEHKSVFSFSMHAENNYPLRKAASSLDIALPDQTGDEDYLSRLETVLDAFSQQEKWDFVFYNAGVDPHRDDRLGRLAMTDEGLRNRDDLVIRHFRGRGIPVCGVIGGGYSSDLRTLAARHAILFEIADRYSGPVNGGS
jgi:acetoin utilization deacetylase AcuC-like enzyme